MHLNPLDLLPHRYPFLLVDQIEVLEAGRKARGCKQVTGAEGQIIGARDGVASVAMPHALIVEALAQLSAAVIAGLEASGAPMVGYFMGCDQVRLRGAAKPGDTIELSVELLQYRRGICRTRAVARVGQLVLVQAVLTTIVRPAVAAKS
jgi:3-hydroxyacyl-[acyl-carrier-protein] dehydratase